MLLVNHRDGARLGGRQNLSPRVQAGESERTRLIEPAKRATETVLVMADAVARSADWNSLTVRDMTPA